MRTKPLYILIFSILSFFGFAQKQTDSTKVKWKYQPNFMVGFDVLNAGIGAFSDRKIFQGFVSTRINGELHAVADAGFEKNIYKKNGYDAKVSGPFLRLGAIYMLVMDPENMFNGLYGGAKLGASFYNQEYFAVPVRGFQGGDISVAFPASTQSSYWFEASLGGRVNLFKSNFYIDVNLQPKYLLFTTKQDDLKPMIVPGFGKSSTKFNMGFSWNVAYKF